MAVLIVALGVLAAATAGLMLLIEPIPSWYYHLAWWSYIVAADGLNHRLAGRSLIRDQPRRFLALAGASVVWWTLFEAINLRLGNWYYVMDHPQRWLRWLGGVSAFATVLPGIVETLELIENKGWLRSVPVAPLRWSATRDGLCVGLGVVCFALPLLWPDQFFPLTWGSFVFLIEPWNRRHARRSFLRDLEGGEAGPLCRTLLAGLVCGVLWETWNYWARTKWIYTVPGFEEWKIFEMPLLGFLGFPPFAVECLVLIRFGQALWETLTTRMGPALPIFGATAAGAVFTLGVFTRVDPVTVDSYYVPVAQIPTLPAEPRQRLASLGLTSPEKLLRALRSPESRRAWSERTGLSEADLEVLRARAALIVHRGLGAGWAEELAFHGIDDLAELAQWTPTALARVLRPPGSGQPSPFRERRARVWLSGLRP